MVPRHPSLLLKIKINKTYSTSLSFCLSLTLSLFLPLSHSLSLSLSPSLSLSLSLSDWLNEEHLEHASTFCFARASRKCGHAVSIPHSASHSACVIILYIDSQVYLGLLFTYNATNFCNFADSVIEPRPSSIFLGFSQYSLSWVNDWQED